MMPTAKKRPDVVLRVINHSLIVHEHEAKGKNQWHTTPGCTCGWRFTRSLHPTLCAKEWVRHLEALGPE